MSEPKINIGIPISNWNNLIEESLFHCLKLNYHNFKIVVVHDKKTKIPSIFKKNKKILFLISNSRSISAKRNLAIKACPADYYACLDSDSYPKDNWLRNALPAFLKNQSIMVVGGPNLSPIYSDSKRRAVSAALKSYLVTGPRSFTKYISDNRFTDDLPTCNFIFKKEVLTRVGYFNESLKTGEDTNFCTRILNNNGYIYYSNNVIVYHHNRKLFLPFMKQKIVFGYAVIPLAKHGFAFRNYFVLPLIFTFFAVFGWVPALIYLPVFYFWGIVMLLFLSAAATDAVRLSKNKNDSVLTFAAIIIGNVFPGIGTLLALIGVKINMKKFYSNFESLK